MTITQTVEIPASCRIFLDLPQELPVGREKVELSISPENLMREKLVFSFNHRVHVHLTTWYSSRGDVISVV